MKRIINISLLSLLAVSLLGCAKVEEKTITSKDVQVTPESVTIKSGESTVLTAVVLPSTATDKRVVWASENESIVKVDQDGRITGVAGGLAYVYATSRDGKSRGACKVIVKPSDFFKISVLGADTGYDFSEGIFVTPYQRIPLKYQSSDGKDHTYSGKLLDSLGTINFVNDTLVLGKPKQSTKKGFIYYNESFLDITTETAYSAHLKFISSMLDTFYFGEETREVGSAVKIEQNTSVPVAVLCQGATEPICAPLFGYRLVSSDPEAIAVSENGDGRYLLTATDKLETQTSISIVFADGTEFLLCVAVVSDIPQGGAELPSMEEETIENEKKK